MDGAVGQGKEELPCLVKEVEKEVEGEGLPMMEMGVDQGLPPPETAQEDEGAGGRVEVMNVRDGDVVGYPLLRLLLRLVPPHLSPSSSAPSSASSFHSRSDSPFLAEAEKVENGNRAEKEKEN